MFSTSRFQTPYFWPSNCWEPENTDYAVYLCKRTMQNKTRLELADYEAENLARLQKMFSRKWEFIFMQVSRYHHSYNRIYHWKPVFHRLKPKAKSIKNVISSNVRYWTRRSVHFGMYIVQCQVVLIPPKWISRKRTDAVRLVMVPVRPVRP